LYSEQIQANSSQIVQQSETNALCTLYLYRSASASNQYSRFSRKL